MRKVYFLISIVILIALFFLYSGLYNPKDPSGEENVFIIESGEGVFSISKNLEEEGIIKHKHLFAFYIFLTGGRGDLKAGIYEISPTMNIVEIAEKIISGEVKKNKITIIEGWNLHDIARYLESEGHGSKEEFYHFAGMPPYYKNGEIGEQKSSNMEKNFSFLEDRPEHLPLEGYLFPDTYSVSPGAKIKDILHIMLSNFERRVVPEIEDKDIFEIITIASLIEKEVITYEDKRLVSGIIRNRMRRGIPLQIDATVVYLTGRRDVNVTTEETRINSPYNTYIVSGFPKGPICNPGIESIKAALDPKESDYLYYLSKPDGETVFSRTLQEHNIAKNKYLR